MLLEMNLNNTNFLKLKVEISFWVLEKFPNSPLINWVGIRGFNWDGYMAFSKKFPENSSSAYNMIAYGYAYGEYGEEPDYDAAYEARLVSVAISRKKKLAIDAIANVVEGKFI